MKDVTFAPGRFEKFTWPLLAVVGGSLFLGGSVEAIGALTPIEFGSPEWEFGTVTGLLNRLPLLGLGLALLLTGALARRRVAATYLWSTILLLVGVLVFVFGLLYATNLPIILRSVPPGPGQVGFYKAVAKTVVQVMVYFIGFLVVSVMGFRAPGRFDKKG